MNAIVPVLLAAALLQGCVRFGYGRTRLEEPLDATALAALQPGRDDLASCLRALGAPHHVFEYRGDGIAIAWYWLDGSDLDLDISYAFGRQFSNASISIDWDDNDLPGAVLWFDEHLVLRESRQGSMRDLTSGIRRRSAPVDDVR